MLEQDRQKPTTMILKLHYNIRLILIIVLAIDSSQCYARRRFLRTTDAVGGGGGGGGGKAISPSLGDEIDLETIEGVEQLTKLVLMKTDSLPGESAERIDGRYLNSLMETLYTGLRKPFKSVSADILGIFPSFEEIQVRCERPARNEHLERDESITEKKGKRSLEANETSAPEQNNSSLRIEATVPNDNGTDTLVGLENDIGYGSYKSSLSVCQAVTNDCLSMDDLVQIVPPTITTFDRTLVRLCPIMLFRIMNQICHKSGDALNSQQDTELISAKMRDGGETISRPSPKDSISRLSTLQILKNLQNSDDLGTKKPQKLHKKLKTPISYKSNGRLNSVNLQKPDVDEQLLKIRLKLSEPSIEKVWIFSLLFVILSIVVSMGGLIVLPFVRKTTRRRILTLFEGLAVGGLAGSATLHMFPQAFGLVDENYHKYFWRIFTVFSGIYLCYLCERTIKIIKVVRARMRRRSRASLIDMDYCYGFPSVNREISGADVSLPMRAISGRLNIDPLSGRFQRGKKTGWVGGNMRKRTDQTEEPSLGEDDECLECECVELHKKSRTHRRKRTRSIEDRLERRLRKQQHKADGKERKTNSQGWQHGREEDDLAGDTLQQQTVDQSSNPTRQRLIQCLRSVQRQFSPVYAVQTQNWDENTDGKRKKKNDGKHRHRANSRSLAERGPHDGKSKRNRLMESRQLFGRVPGESKMSAKRQLKQKEIETMLFHKNRMRQQQNNNDVDMERNYVQQRLTSVKDVAAERQDQDNAARMSVDTVAWMIVFGDAVLNVIDGLSIGAAFERNILAGISISVAVMLEEVTHRLGTFAVLIRAGMSMQQSLLCTFLSACALFPGLIIGILLSDATEDATPYIFCAAGGIFLYMVSSEVKNFP